MHTTFSLTQLPLLLPTQILERKAAEASCKTIFVLALLRELAATGHRTLVFSQSRVMLDILQVGSGGGGEGLVWLRERSHSWPHLI